MYLIYLNEHARILCMNNINNNNKDSCVLFVLI